MAEDRPEYSLRPDGANGNPGNASGASPLQQLPSTDDSGRPASELDDVELHSYPIQQPIHALPSAHEQGDVEVEDNGSSDRTVRCSDTLP